MRHIATIIGGVALAATAALALPRIARPPAAPTAPKANAAQVTQENDLRADLSDIRSAEYKFFTDTNAWPLTLNDLAAATPAALSTPNRALAGTGEEVPVTAKQFHGPYLNEVPQDPVSEQPWVYSTTPGTIGVVSSAAAGAGVDGTPYKTW